MGPDMARNLYSPACSVPMLTDFRIVFFSSHFRYQSEGNRDVSDFHEVL